MGKSNRKIQGCDFKTIHGNDYETPKWFFDSLNKEFNFTFDLACSTENRKCLDGYTKEDNSLLRDWHKLGGWLWLNPPYSPIRQWIEKAQSESLLGAKIVMLIPPLIHTAYFNKVIPSEIRFIDKRLGFIVDGKPMSGNTHYSCLCIYGPPTISKISLVKRDSFKPTPTAEDVSDRERRDEEWKG
jgi:DNA (cytosine-5)-methyltransferase 1